MNRVDMNQVGVFARRPCCMPGEPCGPRHVETEVNTDCGNCGKSETVSQEKKHARCARCETVYYCSRDCQSAHWKIHKKTSCKKKIYNCLICNQDYANKIKINGETLGVCTNCEEFIYASFMKEMQKSNS